MNRIERDDAIRGTAGLRWKAAKRILIEWLIVAWALALMVAVAYWCARG
jgi:phosphate/sulfate permease